ncbi:MAG: hypothetical protein WCA64_10445 [Gallionella sp.]
MIELVESAVKHEWYVSTIRPQKATSIITPIRTMIPVVISCSKRLKYLDNGELVKSRI